MRGLASPAEQGVYMKFIVNAGICVVLIIISLTITNMNVRASPGVDSPCTSSSVVDQSQIELVSDCEALWAFYTALTDKGSLDDDAESVWGTGVALEDWKGVTVSGGRVTRLSVYKTDIEGELVPELGNLDRLRDLNLLDNRLSGSIPTQLMELSRLNVIRLSHNDLSGPIPPELGNLRRLRIVDLSKNELSGSIPPELGNLRNLTHLSLDSNDLSGPIPTELGNLRNMTSIHIGRNNYSGSIPREFGNLRKLVHLSLWSSGLSGVIPPELGNLPNLRSLFLSNNALSGAIPSELTNATNLRHVLLNNNHLSGAIPPALGELTNLSILNLRDNPLALPVPNSLTNPRGGLFVQLPLAWAPAAPTPAYVVPDNESLRVFWQASDGAQYYTVSYAPVGSGTESQSVKTQGTSVTLSSLSNGVTYEVVVAAINSTGATPAPDPLTATPSVCAAATGLMSHISVYSIPDCGALWTFFAALEDNGSIDDDVGSSWGPNVAFDEWKGVTVVKGRVTALALSNGGLHGELVSDFGGLSNLQRLDLAGNSLSGPIPAEFARLVSLDYLDLSNNGLSGSIPVGLGELSALRYMNLSGNGFSGSIPADLGELTNLEALILSNNSLSGSIPSELSHLAQLLILLLADNSLTGSIPTELGRLHHLSILNLSDNSISSTIPPDLGNLTNLFHLDLSSNDLEELIPPELGELPNLTFLSLWDNPLRWPPPENLVDPRPELSVHLPSAWVPPPPSDLTVNTKDRSLVVSWSASHGAESYTVFYAAAGTQEEPAEATTDETTTIVDGLNNGVAYNVYVTASNSVGTSPGSETVTATPGSCGAALDLMSNTSAALLSDCEALWAFYTALDDTGSLDDDADSAWSPSVPFENWAGVTVAGGRVTRLVVTSAGLEGELVPELGDLTSLTFVDLDDNQLTGAIPPGLSNLIHLQIFDVSSNSLSGSIPSELGDLPSLDVLDLSRNSLSGSIPPELADLERLTLLHLGYNDLSGLIPSELGNLDNLALMYLNDNRLSGPIPDELAELPNLVVLALRGNPLSWPPPNNVVNPRTGLSVLLPDAWVPPAPSEVTTLSVNEALLVGWAQSHGAVSYTVAYVVSGSGDEPVEVTTTEGLILLDGLSNGVAYDVYVTASNAVGTSLPSETVTATPSAF